MFGFGEDKPAKIKTSINGIDSIISKDTVVNGPMTIKGSLKVEGEVNGAIFGGNADPKLETSVLVESTGKIQGSVICKNVIINGIVEGHINAVSVHLGSNARVTGNINYQVLQIEPGAVVVGELKSMVPNNQSNVQPIQQEAA